MKKSKILLPLALLGMVFGVAACNQTTDESKADQNEPQSQASIETDPAKQVKINITAPEGKKSILYGETLQLSADQEGVAWESSKPEVATIDANGLVTAVSKGSTTIKASKLGFKDGSMNVSVNYPDITIAASGEKDILLGGTLTLTASEQGVIWSSTDPEVAKVENGVVTGLKLGSATIKASKEHFNDGSVTINVVRPEASAQFDLVIAADHYSADGWWELPAAAGGFGFAMQQVAGWNPTSQAMSWGQGGEEPAETFVGGFGVGDKETVKFNAAKVGKAELVLNIGNSDEAVLSEIMSIKLNNKDVSLAGVTLEAHSGDWGNTLEFSDLSLGELDLAQGENTLVFEFLVDTNIFLNELDIYAGGAVTLVEPTAKEQITVTNDKLEVIEGETVQIETAVTGVSYAVVDVDFVSVNESGLVTGLKVGKTNVTVKKEGMYSVRVEVIVNPKPVSGQIIVEAEDGEEVATEWGGSTYMKQVDGSGMGMGDSTAVHSGGAYVSFFSMGGDADLTLTIKFEATEAKAMVLSVVGSAPGSWQGEGSPYVFAESAELSFNGAALTFTDQAFPAASGMNPEMVEIVLGDVDVVAGENVIVFHTTGAAPALDCFKLSIKA